MDACGETLGLAHSVGEASEQCEIYRASDGAPHTPIVRVPAISTAPEKLQVKLPSLGDAIASHAMAVLAEDSLLTLERPGNPQIADCHTRAAEAHSAGCGR